MGIAFNKRTVHERTGIAFVRIADEILLVTFGVACGVPLEPCGESRSTASGKTRNLDLFDHLLWGQTLRIC